ncbi:PhnA domain-containing protein [Galbibacter sp. EGI 63066]|uniref:PhnA domain-containing protein n=1 Tax=Galbibacter sp. EGI 63066 TaxID=2993559 RepID=UPI002248E701|nr:alkylphosphonate utilization protein [Galbibacter sp. EGI 63066]MCX2680611.1 PhnA domain-containing protein [Galbibacter sp. EGI 63066]
MSVVEKKLKDRSGSKCELCGNEHDLQVYEVPPTSTGSLENSILACDVCVTQLEDPEKVDVNHWRCLNDSMWSEHLPVQIVAWRMLTRLRDKGWPQDLLDMMYLDEEALEWAKATGEGEDEEEKIVHKDSNGNILQDGDSVVLIKDLNVKGANFTAKRGAAVHRISLVWDNAEQIEGRVDGQQIVILTQYVKKTK